jgi:hypothetical protein
MSFKAVVWWPLNKLLYLEEVLVMQNKRFSNPKSQLCNHHYHAHADAIKIK